MMTMQKANRITDLTTAAWVFVGASLFLFGASRFDDWFVSNTPMAREYAQAMTVACGFILCLGRAFAKRQPMIRVGLIGVMILSAPSWFGQSSVPEKVILEYVSLVVSENGGDGP